MSAGTIGRHALHANGWERMSPRRGAVIADDEHLLLLDLLEQVGDLVQSVGPDGRFLYVNRAWQQTLGYTREEARALAFPDILRADSLAHCQAAFARVMAGDSLAHADAIFVARDGSEVPVSGSVNPRLEDGAIRGTVGIFRDMRETRQRVFDRTLLAALWDVSPDGILVVSPDGVILGVNDRLRELAGLPASLGIGAPVSAVREVLDERAGLPESATTTAFDRVTTAAGRTLDRFTAALCDEGVPLGRVWFFRDVSEQRALEQQLQHQALHDDLTGLANRKLLLDRIGQALARRAGGGPAVALIFLDLDGFKEVNDAFGHECGDRLLAITAERLLTISRDSDTVARIGGDEFVLLLAGVADEAAATRVAQRAVAVVQQPYRLSGATARVSASAGIALASGAAERADQLLLRADHAMYAAKRAGRNRWVLADAALASTGG